MLSYIKQVFEVHGSIVNILTYIFDEFITFLNMWNRVIAVKYQIKKKMCKNSIKIHIKFDVCVLNLQSLTLKHNDLIKFKFSIRSFFFFAFLLLQENLKTPRLWLLVLPGEICFDQWNYRFHSSVTCFDKYVNTIFGFSEGV